MSASALNQLFSALKIQAKIFHNGQYCGVWAVDTSGSNLMNFHVITKGSCVINVDQQHISLSTGDAVFMPCDEEHQITASGDNAIKSNQCESLPMNEALNQPSTGLVCGRFVHDHPLFIRLLEQLPKVIIVRHEKNRIATSILTLIVEESKRAENSENFLLNRLADALFYILVRDNIHASNGVLAAMSHPKLNKPLKLIHNQLEKPLSIEVLAECAGMSRSAFSALFKDVTQLSPAEYITQWRMTQAYRWLADEGISTLSAALQSGYESEASFSKAFKRVNGISPGEVRKRNHHTK